MNLDAFIIDKLKREKEESRRREKQLEIPLKEGDAEPRINEKEEGKGKTPRGVWETEI